MNEQRRVEKYAHGVVARHLFPAILHTVQIIGMKQAQADIDEVKKRKDKQDQAAADPKSGCPPAAPKSVVQKLTRFSPVFRQS
ncbi:MULTISPECIES: hypothetical protein [unclassified Ruegeria]|uniref:hypothetical protein n=1 Tax=unclassified Ruegeria TaxID=2625375 RepID=UPI00209F60E9|nr:MULTISPECIES: hypothetical protein [unclassified Ruegeria]